MNDNQISNLLVAFEGIGAIFAGAFLLAYLLGLPTDVVYHSDPNLRLVLTVVGGIFVLLTLVTFGVFIRTKEKE
jgi:hypothetical protein